MPLWVPAASISAGQMAADGNFGCCRRRRAAESTNAGQGIAMLKQPRRFVLKNHPLGVSIAAALAVKTVALTALYLAFFVPPPNPIPPSERAATAVLGLPAVKP
jgi:hypothetical protein